MWVRCGVGDSLLLHSHLTSTALSCPHSPEKVHVRVGPRHISLYLLLHLHILAVGCGGVGGGDRWQGAIEWGVA